MLEYDFPAHPVAEDDAVICGPNYRFTIINDVVLRYEWSADGTFEDRASTFAINRRFSQRPKPVVQDSEVGLEIMTPSLHLLYDKKRFSPGGLVVDLKSKTTLWGAQWRFGHTPEENLGGTARTLDGVNGRCDMGTGILSKAGYSVVDDSDTMLFDDSGFVSPRKPGDRIDGYLFAYGRDYKAAMNAFFALSGQTPRLPRWALGNWWSRYHKYTTDSYLKLMDDFQKHDIPLSVAVIDMDWHLVQDEKVPHAGWTGYTWDRKLFPDPVAFQAALHDRDLKVTLNDHPHAGIHHHEEQYDEVARFMGRDPSEKIPIIFDPTDPKFMQAFFDIVHRSLEKQGCDFWWIDWQQGALSRIPGFDPLWLLNHYQFLDTQKQQQKAEHGDRALIFSRYAGPGSHRYPVGFSGDSVVSWESLAFQPEFTATASNIGYGWWSHDVGGHYGGSRDDELVARWVQLGVFSPIMRLHSADNAWCSKEPWLYRPEASQAMTFAMRLRHRLMPYLYSANVDFSEKNEAIVQPLYWRFPLREEAYEHPNQYFFGLSLVVAPIVQPRDAATLHASAEVWLPPTAARYVDLFTGMVYDSDRTLDMWRTLQTLPVLAPEGSIIVLDASGEPANGGFNPQALEVIVVVGQDAEYVLVEDIRDDKHCRATRATKLGDYDRHIEFKWDQKAGEFRTNLPLGYGLTVRFLCVDDCPPSDVLVTQDRAIDYEKVVSIEKGNNVLSPGTVVRLGSKPAAADVEEWVAIRVVLRPDQQLGVADYVTKIKSLLLDFQMDFRMKDVIFQIVSGSQPVHSKISALLRLELPRPIMGVITEVLLADSRH